MKKYLLIIFGMLFFVSAAFAQDFAYKPVGFQMITIDSTTGGIGLNPGSADRAIIVVETANLRFCVTESCAPTSSFGTPLDMGQAWVLETIDEVKNFKAIRTGSTSAKISVIYMKSYRVTSQ